MSPLLPPSSTPERHPLRHAVFARTGCQPRVQTRGRRDATRRAMGTASHRKRVAARRPTVNPAAVRAAVSAPGSFLH